MNVNLGDFRLILEGDRETLFQRLEQLARDLEGAFADIPVNPHTYHVDLNFDAPGAVPGVTDEEVTVDGVEFGDTVLVGCSIAPPPGFQPPIGFVSAANKVTVRWVQLTGTAADPDGVNGASYTLDIWRH